MRTPHTRRAAVATRRFRMPQPPRRAACHPENGSRFLPHAEADGTCFFFVLVYSLMQGATNEPPNSRAIHKQKSCYVDFQRKERIGRCQSLATNHGDRSLPPWLGGRADVPAIPIRVSFPWLSFLFRWDMSGDMSLLGDICDPPKYYPCRGDHN